MPYCSLCGGYHDFHDPCKRDNQAISLPPLNPPELPNFSISTNLTEPLTPRIEIPMPPPFEPVRDSANYTIGYLDRVSNQLHPVAGGQPLHVELNTVYDSAGNEIGRLGPGNFMQPPLTFDIPDYGPPPAGPDGFDPPGF